MAKNRFIGKAYNDIGFTVPRSSFVFVGEPEIRRKDFVGSVWYHDVALIYSKRGWAVTVGLNNVTNQAPPLISLFQPNQHNNAVSSSGYDFMGRTLYATASMSV